LSHRIGAIIENIPTILSGVLQVIEAVLGVVWTLVESIWDIICQGWDWLVDNVFSPIGNWIYEGTKGIWTYRKWNSGIAECWGTTSPKTLTLNTAWGNLYTNNTSLINNAISYPFSFTATPAVVASTIFNNTSYWAVMANSGGVSSSPKYKAVMPQSGSATCSLHFRVIGKWK